MLVCILGELVRFITPTLTLPLRGEENNGFIFVKGFLEQ
jgi:hypothetical protein